MQRCRQKIPRYAPPASLGADAADVVVLGLALGVRGIARVAVQSVDVGHGCVAFGLPKNEAANAETFANHMCEENDDFGRNFCENNRFLVLIEQLAER